jgi:hypothetical protein
MGPFEENEYWLKRYGHKRWFPKYVDQSGAKGAARWAEQLGFHTKGVAKTMGIFDGLWMVNGLG